MIRRKAHDRGAQQWAVLLFHADNRQSIQFCYTKEEAEEYVHKMGNAFDCRYAYITEVKESFYAGRG